VCTWPGGKDDDGGRRHLRHLLAAAAHLLRGPRRPSGVGGQRSRVGVHGGTYFVVQNLEPTLICYRHIQHVYLVIYWFAMSNSMYNRPATTGAELSMGWVHPWVGLRCVEILQFLVGWVGLGPP